MARSKKPKASKKHIKKTNAFKRKAKRNLNISSSTRREQQEDSANCSTPCFYIDTTPSFGHNNLTTTALASSKDSGVILNVLKSNRQNHSKTNSMHSSPSFSQINKSQISTAAMAELANVENSIDTTTRCWRSPGKKSKKIAEKIRQKWRKYTKERMKKAYEIHMASVSPKGKTDVCTHYAVPADVAKCWYERVRQRLSQPEATRAYHNWQEMMLRKEAQLKNCKPSIVLAAFFQYYVYDGNRNCSKENCAAFEEFCRDAQIEDTETKSSIMRLLGDKRNETEELPSNFECDANLLQDLDLIILAAAPAEYEAYTKLLRQEYANLNEQSYKQMRLKVLETLLMIPNIFATPEYQAKYEALSRNNIKWEISCLKTQ